MSAHVMTRRQRAAARAARSPGASTWSKPWPVMVSTVPPDSLASVGTTLVMGAST